MNPLTKQVDQATLNDWGELSGDLNPLHVDPAYAAGTRYGGTILHGHLTIAWLSEWALREWGAAWLTHGSLADLRFRAPLRPGVEYVVSGEPVESGGAESGARGARGDVRDGDVRLAVLLPDGSAGVTATARLARPERAR
ncbi:MaoC family dehydratase [Conexibacter sp. CPCC 206217]|uniref:MaoC family dehydratase n=1 Tax=Conexibacter sp. CPCC 206217 TaxID=3064574 RepID=UPI00271CED7A|nr:MaoC family dehydratase [Conexibacter sp. CPCC 206217]MDO8211108.1 MaoC family dehydratase [Conexibacter sp. CPCC 206217]